MAGAHWSDYTGKGRLVEVMGRMEQGGANRPLAEKLLLK